MTAADADVGSPARGAMASLSDEVVWELVRDEWELMLAVGTGPSLAADAAKRAGLTVQDATERLALLSHHGVVDQTEAGFSLRPIYHQRREGMASYLRDLVLRHLQIGGPAPVAAGVRDGLGDMERVRGIVAQAQGGLLPGVVDAASVPEGPDAARYWLVFAAAVNGGCPKGEAEYTGATTVIPAVLRVLKAAAGERMEPSGEWPSKLWVAEMRAAPAVAKSIGRRFESFLESLSGDEKGTGAVAFAVLPVLPQPTPAV